MAPWQPEIAGAEGCKATVSQEETPISRHCGCCMPRVRAGWRGGLSSVKLRLRRSTRVLIATGVRGLGVKGSALVVMGLAVRASRGRGCVVWLLRGVVCYVVNGCTLFAAGPGAAAEEQTRRLVRTSESSQGRRERMGLRSA